MKHCNTTEENIISIHSQASVFYCSIIISEKQQYNGSIKKILFFKVLVAKLYLLPQFIRLLNLREL